MVDPLLPAVIVAIAVATTPMVVAVYRRNVAAIVNAAVGVTLTVYATALAVSPELVLGRELDVGMTVPLWLALASTLHSIGMLGWYESLEWWDHVTHTVSAALVAAVLYAALLVTDPQVPVVAGLPYSTGILTLSSTLVIGVAWELAELVGRTFADSLDVEPVLIHYGRRDTALDLVFDAVGALLVVGLDVRVFVAAAEQDPHFTASVLEAATWFVGLGSILMAGFLVLETVAETE